MSNSEQTQLQEFEQLLKQITANELTYRKQIKDLAPSKLQNLQELSEKIEDFITFYHKQQLQEKGMNLIYLLSYIITWGHLKDISPSLFLKGLKNESLILWGKESAKQIDKNFLAITIPIREAIAKILHTQESLTNIIFCCLRLIHPLPLPKLKFSQKTKYNELKIKKLITDWQATKTYLNQQSKNSVSCQNSHIELYTNYPFQNENNPIAFSNNDLLVEAESKSQVKMFFAQRKKLLLQDLLQLLTIITETTQIYFHDKSIVQQEKLLSQVTFRRLFNLKNFLQLIYNLKELTPTDRFTLQLFTPDSARGQELNLSLLCLHYQELPWGLLLDTPQLTNFGNTTPEFIEDLDLSNLQSNSLDYAYKLQLYFPDIKSEFNELLGYLSYTKQDPLNTYNAISATELSNEQISLAEPLILLHDHSITHDR